jgi:polyhydroxybutyrate depolymerase
VERAVPVLAFHGTKDQLVDYNGDGPWGFRGARENVEHWPGRLGCEASFEQTFQQGDATCEKLPACNGGAEANLCTLEGGGHTWPGAAWFPGLGKVSHDLDATDRMLDFFEGHGMP